VSVSLSTIGNFFPISRFLLSVIDYSCQCHCHSGCLFIIISQSHFFFFFPMKISPEKMAAVAASEKQKRPDGTDMWIEPKKHQVVCMWSWNNVVDKCGICRNEIYDLCVECQANQGTPGTDECQVAWGVCNHTFHHHCISHWLRRQSICPLCSREWEYSKVCSQHS
jgi:RING-box protein 1